MNKVRINTIQKGVAKITIILSIFLLNSLQLHASNTEWSWRNISLGLTTETEIWRNLGEPSSVILFPKDYMKIKKREQPNEVIYKYQYTILKRKDENLFFKRTPLSISDEIISIDTHFIFNNSILQSYSIRYRFMPNKTISPEKYVGIFSQMLGKPTKYKEQMKIKTYHFKNHFMLSFWPDTISEFTMELQCHPDN